MNLNYNIQNYIDLIESGEILACPEQHKGIQLIKNVFQNEDVYVDDELAERYFALEKYFPFRLFPWERYCFTIHNCMFRRDGFLRFPELQMAIGRESGKNGYSSFEQFSWISPVNGIKNFDVGTFAVAQDNAKQSFDELYSILESNPNYFKKYFTWSQTKITNKKTGSKIYYGTSAPKSKDGGRQGGLVFDEMHAYENSALLDVLEGGIGKIPNGRITKITSFGDVRDGPMDEMIDNAEDILNGVIDDNGTYPFICRLPNDDMVHDEKNWVMANPSIIYLPTVLESWRRDYNKYKRNPTSHLAFMTKKMGRPKGTNKKPVTSLDNIKATNQPLPDTDGMYCIPGFDYARLNDFVTAGFLFLVDNKVVWKSHTWVCSQSKDLYRIKAPLKKWEADGLLTFVDGPEIPADVPAEWVESEIEKHGYIPVNACLDNYRLSLMKKALGNIGFDCDKNGNNNIKLVRPSDIIKTVPVIDSYFTNHNIIWGDSPLMRWYVNNAMLRPEKREEFSYGKQEPKSRKTDGFMAFAAAMTSLDELQQYTAFDDFEVKVYKY